MSSSSQPIERARLFQIRQESKLSLLDIRETEGVSNFKEKLKEDDEKGAVEEVEKCSSKKAKGEMLRIALDSRKNDFIISVLQSALDKQESVSNGSGVDEPDNRQSTGSDDIFQNAVMNATLNDDPETLKAVLDWGFNNNQKAPEEKSGGNKNKNKSCPILVASLENYTQCIKHLYNFGYRIGLPKEDKERIEKVLKMKDALANDIHFFFALTSGNENMETDRYRTRKVGKASLLYDPVERYLRFKASANPNYISIEFLESDEDIRKDFTKLRMLDPIRKSFALAQYSKHLSSYYTQHSQEYKEIGRKCQEFAENVLEQCDNLQEVETLLEYSPNLDDDENNENTNWHLALWEGHKRFVGHHYFQNFLWDKITGDNFNWDNYFFFWRVLYFPLAALLFCLVPFIVLADSIFRKSDILFVSPEMLEKKMGKADKTPDPAIPMELFEEEKQNSSIIPMINADKEKEHEDMEQSEKENKHMEHSVFSFFRERIHRPIFRMIVYHFLEVIYLIALGFSMYDPKDTVELSVLWSYDIITIVFVVSYFFENIIDIFRRKWTSFSSFWSFYSLVNHSLFMLGGLLSAYGFWQLKDSNRAILSGNNPVNVGSTFVSMAASMAFFRICRWFLLQRTLGPVVVCIIKVLRDAFHIFLLFLIIFVSFAVGTFSMFKTFKLNTDSGPHDNSFQMEKEQSLANVKSLFSSMFWRVFDPGEPELASIVNATSITSDGKNYDDILSLDFSHFMGLAFWAIYQATIVILLINILIAMMNTTYTKVSEHADLHWKYSKSYYQIQFLAPRAVLPPPFRFIYYFAKFMRYLKGKCTCCNSAYCCDSAAKDVREDKEDKNKEYRDLLQKLVKTKQHSDYENSIQDDFRDLRQDIQNMVSDKQKPVHKEMNELKKMMEELLKNNQELKSEIQSLRKQ